MKEKMSTCGICKKRFLSRSLSLHVINTAKAEAYSRLMNMLKLSRNKPYTFSPLILRKNAPHVNLTLKNFFVERRKIMKQFAFNTYGKNKN